MSMMPGACPPRLGLGIASFTLGVMGLLLFFFPILGMPISAIGVLVGIIGLWVTASAARTRLILTGLVISALALAINIAMFYAPAGGWSLHDDARDQRPYMSPGAP
jgi:hypothetical protein